MSAGGGGVERESGEAAWEEGCAADSEESRNVRHASRHGCVWDAYIVRAQRDVKLAMHPHVASGTRARTDAPKQHIHRTLSSSSYEMHHCIHAFGWEGNSLVQRPVREYKFVVDRPGNDARPDLFDFYPESQKCQHGEVANGLPEGARLVSISFHSNVSCVQLLFFLGHRLDCAQAECEPLELESDVCGGVAVAVEAPRAIGTEPEAAEFRHLGDGPLIRLLRLLLGGV
eukprot:2971225-Prymnesium_polylepis.1